MSTRITFRDANKYNAYQKQLRDARSDEGVPNLPHLSVRKAIVRPITTRLAKQIILKYEWLGTMSNTTYHFGIFFGIYCAGVTCVAVGTGTGGTNVAKMFGLAPQQMAILARGANVHWSPPNANSKLVSYTCKLLPKECPNAKLIIAYADTDAGEIGTIYQACNWNYISTGNSTTQYVSPEGRVFDQRNISHWSKRHRVSWTEQRDSLLTHGWTQQDSNPKHRYVQIIDRSDTRLVRLVNSLSFPYPKRAKAKAVA